MTALRRGIRELTIVSVETALLLTLAATLGLSRAEMGRESDIAQANERSRKAEQLGGGGDDAPSFSSEWHRDIPLTAQGTR